MFQPATLPHGRLGRRAFLAGSLAATAAALAPRGMALTAEPARPTPTFCAFIKFVQSLGYEEMAARIAELGFDGIESTVRRGGHVLPQRVEEDLPRQVEAVRKHGMDVTIMTTDVLGLDDPLTEKVLRTAAKLGIKKYRMSFYRYSPKRSVMAQLDEIRPRLLDLAAFNRELGLTAVYQNHSGSIYVGAPIWDLHYLFKGISADDVGIAFDIRHATVEGGLSWPIQYDIMKPHIGAVFVKDFAWNGTKVENIALGKGRVERKFFQMHAKSGIHVPYSVHVEYLGQAGVEENLAALKTDLKTLQSWL
ncbi:MAG TPA: sugar phosphate isomerase/epimerase, partial [Planctomycetaceae bacterium]|nr:sugar phosphate isomerase/epimerase [Planctomycetaceae bacterium]